MESRIRIGMLLFVVFIPSCHLMSLHEPKCSSRYDFEEKLLEKSVKIDHQMKILQNIVDKRLEELQSEKVRMSSDLSTMSAHLEELSKQLKHEQQLKNVELTNLAKTVNDTIKQNMEEVNAEMKTTTTKNVEEMDKMMELQKSQVARMSHDMLILTNETLDKMKGKQVAFTVTKPKADLLNGVPTFTRIDTNIGGGYNAETGQFTCPVAGLYQFSLTMISKASGQTGYCYIRINGSNKWFIRANTPYMSGTLVVHVLLQSGDVVNIGSCNNWNHVEKNFGTVFSGILVTES